MNFWRDISKPIVGLSPMDGVTDASFRFIAAKYGRPDVVFTEFVNIQSALYSPHQLIKDLSYSEIERPVVAQIYGRDPELFYRVAHIVGELGFDGLDINMGCPSRKVAAAGCGAALIRTPKLAGEIIRAARRGIEDWSGGQSLARAGFDDAIIDMVQRAIALRGGGDSHRPRRLIPLSVKTRLGYDCNVLEEWIPTLLAERPAVISLHGRTLQQGYKGHADWQAIGRAVEIARGSETPILGNGDIQDLVNASKRVCESGVAGVLLGRAAQGNPWIFGNKNLLKTRTDDVNEGLRPSPIALAERFRVILEHCRHYESLCFGQHFVAMRKHLAWYCKGFRGAAELRAQMMGATSAADVAANLEKFMMQLPPELPRVHAAALEPRVPLASPAAG